MSISNEPVVRQIERDGDRLKELVNGDLDATVQLENRTVPSYERQVADKVDAALGDSVGNLPVTTSTGTQTLAVALDKRVIYVDTVADLQALDTSRLVDGQVASVGGADFRWEDSLWKPTGIINAKSFGIRKENTYSENGLAIDELNSYMAELSSNGESGEVYFPPGKYQTDVGLVFPVGFFTRSPGATIDASGQSASGFPEGGVVTLKGDEPVPLPSISANLGVGSLSVSFSSTHGLEKGDFFYLIDPNDFSFSEHRDYYKRGEFCKVRDVTSSTQVVIYQPLAYSYNTTDCDAFYMPFNQAKKFCINSIAPGIPGESTHAVFLNRVQGCDFSGIRAENSANSSLALVNCFECEANGLDAYQEIDGGFETDYGLAFISSQSCRASGVFHGRRHGFTYTGGPGIHLPNKDCSVEGVFTSVAPAIGLGPADFHGNTDRCVISGVCYGSAQIAGKNNKVDLFISDSVTNSGIALYASEMVSINHDITLNGTVNGDPTSDGRGIIDFGGNANAIDVRTTEGGTLKISGRVVCLGISGSTNIFNLNNRGSLQDGLVDCSDLELISSVTPSRHFRNVASGGGVRYKFVGPSWGGRATITTSTSQTASFVDINYPYIIDVGGNAISPIMIIGAITSGSATRLDYYIQNATNSSFRATVTTRDNSNFAASTNIPVYYTASIDTRGF